MTSAVVWPSRDWHSKSVTQKKMPWTAYLKVKWTRQSVSTIWIRIHRERTLFSHCISRAGRGSSRQIKWSLANCISSIWRAQRWLRRLDPLVLCLKSHVSSTSRSVSLNRWFLHFRARSVDISPTDRPSWPISFATRSVVTAKQWWLLISGLKHATWVRLHQLSSLPREWWRLRMRHRWIWCWTRRYKSNAWRKRSAIWNKSLQCMIHFQIEAVSTMPVTIKLNKLRFKTWHRRSWQEKGKTLATSTLSERSGRSFLAFVSSIERRNRTLRLSRDRWRQTRKLSNRCRRSRRALHLNNRRDPQTPRQLKNQKSPQPPRAKENSLETTLRPTKKASNS